MIYINTSSTEQVIRYIPRKYEGDFVLLTDEDTKATYAVGGSFAIEGYYNTFELSLNDLKEGSSYNIVVVKGASSTFKDSLTASNNFIKIDGTITQLIIIAISKETARTNI